MHARSADGETVRIGSVGGGRGTVVKPPQIRIGIHSGPVIAGVIGSHRFLYDIWGEAVNLASRLESHGLPGRIHVSAQTVRILTGRYEFEPRGLVNLRGIGKVQTSFLIGRNDPATLQRLERDQRVGRHATLGSR